MQVFCLPFVIFKLTGSFSPLCDDSKKRRLRPAECVCARACPCPCARVCECVCAYASATCQPLADKAAHNLSSRRRTGPQRNHTHKRNNAIPFKVTETLMSRHLAVEEEFLSWRSKHPDKKEDSVREGKIKHQKGSRRKIGFFSSFSFFFFVMYQKA